MINEIRKLLKETNTPINCETIHITVHYTKFPKQECTAYIFLYSSFETGITKKEPYTEISISESGYPKLYKKACEEKVFQMECTKEEILY